eukprot:TRINITY_DN399_c0_g3_i1.p1 TRINITY_DN399_c0_g3~~TRINITY_DN399_c0_g3_i1.p1  ORF type:complete len:1268 (+),score=390.50 TRINITY_DN399_c0_g3_i1:4126-7929(+)
MDVPENLKVRLGFAPTHALQSLNGLWLLRARDELSKALDTLDDVLRVTVYQRIHRLCEGRWSKHPLSSDSSLVHLMRVGSAVLVWTVDIEPSRTGITTQYLSLFHLVTSRAALPAAVAQLKACIADDAKRNGMRHVMRRMEPLREKSGFTLPRTWTPEQVKLLEMEQKAKAKASDKARTEACKKKQEAMAAANKQQGNAAADEVVISKYFDVSQEFLRGLLSGHMGDLPMALDATEKELVENPGSLVVCGRSGTGKTTVLLYRMFGLERACAEAGAAGVERRIRQLFVTVSPGLCSHARSELFSQLRATPIAAEVTTASPAPAQDSSQPLDEIEQDVALGEVPDAFTQLTDKHFPLFLTYRKLLNMLDASLEKPFHRAQGRGPLTGYNNSWSTEAGADSCKLACETAAATDRSWDDLMFSITGTAEASCKSKAVATAEENKLRRAFQTHEVDYVRFERDYWPHMNQKLAGDLDAARLWVEIQSEIKGNVLEILPEGPPCLTNVQYSDVCKRRHSTVFNPDKVYVLFRQYETAKSRNCQWDMADFALHVYRSLRARPVQLSGARVDYVYVDEVQDCTVSQLALLHFLCQRRGGYALVGDTAQTIQRGVSFRFDALKDMFFRMIANEEADAVPEVQHLRKNFRTHQGICKLANSVTHIILHFFPEAIDNLGDESAPGPGIRPIFLRGGRNSQAQQVTSDLLSKLFSFGKKDARISFGAKQVILVRDQQAKQRWRDRIGSGLVLTITEAKGLEFQDVLLLDFWRDSPALGKWRVIYQYMQDNGLAGVPPASSFSEKHLILCMELKHLYTAVTRARNTLVMMDDSAEDHQPMLDYWLALGVVSMQESLTQEQSSSLANDAQMHPAEWSKAGDSLMRGQNYKEAIRCYQYAGDHMMGQRAEALLLFTEGKSEQSKQKLIEAAKIFGDMLGLPEHQARCLVEAGEFLPAADIYLRLGKAEQAVRCYLQGDKPDLAFKIEEQRDPESALSIALDKCSDTSDQKPELRTLRHMALLLLQRHQHLCQTEGVITFVRYSALLYSTKKQLDYLQDALRILPPRDRIRFLTRYNHLDLLVTEYAEQGKTEEVAEIIRGKHNYKMAGELFLKAAAAAAAPQPFSNFWSSVTAPEKRTKLLGSAAQSLLIAAYTSAGPNADAGLLHKAFSAARDAGDRTLQLELELRLAAEEHKQQRDGDVVATALQLGEQARSLGAGGLHLSTMAAELVVRSELKRPSAPRQERLEHLRAFVCTVTELVKAAHSKHTVGVDDDPPQLTAC